MHSVQPLGYRQHHVGQERSLGQFVVTNLLYKTVVRDDGTKVHARQVEKVAQTFPEVRMPLLAGRCRPDDVHADAQSSQGRPVHGHQGHVIREVSTSLIQWL